MQFEKGFVYAIITLLFWGIAPIFAKLGVSRIEAVSAFEIRSIGVIFSFFIYSVVFNKITKYPAIISANWQTTLILFIEGCLGAVIGQIFYYHAQKYWPASKTILVVAGFPMLTVILSYIFLKEPFTIKKIIGMFLISSGILLISSK